MKEEAIKRRSLGRLYTIKALIDLGRGWHTSGEVMSWLKPYTHTNYVFEVAGRWPELVEIRAPNKEVRIRPDAFSAASKSIDKVIEEVDQSVNAQRRNLY